MNAKTKPDPFKLYMELQWNEIEKYKWYLGEKLGHDPLLDRSMNSICQEWIAKYAAAFRMWFDANKERLLCCA